MTITEVWFRIIKGAKLQVCSTVHWLCQMTVNQRIRKASVKDHHTHPVENNSNNVNNGQINVLWCSHHEKKSCTRGADKVMSEKLVNWHCVWHRNYHFITAASRFVVAASLLPIKYAHMGFKTPFILFQFTKTSVTKTSMFVPQN